MSLLPKHIYSLNNKIYPYVYLDREMQRLFGDDIFTKTATSDPEPSLTLADITSCEAIGGDIPEAPPQYLTTAPDRIGFPAWYRTRAHNLRQKKQECKFCKRNGEPPEVFHSHTLKDKNEKIVCPILREFKCKLCGATGDKAHTRKYCPLYTEIDFNSIYN